MNGNSTGDLMAHDLKKLLPLPAYAMFDAGDGTVALVITYPGPVRRVTIEIEKGAAGELFLLQEKNKNMWERLYRELTSGIGTFMAICANSKLGQLAMVITELSASAKKLESRLAAQKSVLQRRLD